MLGTTTVSLLYTIKVHFPTIISHVNRHTLNCPTYAHKINCHVRNGKLLEFSNSASQYQLIYSENKLSCKFLLVHDETFVFVFAAQWISEDGQSNKTFVRILFSIGCAGS